MVMCCRSLQTMLTPSRVLLNQSVTQMITSVTAMIGIAIMMFTISPILNTRCFCYTAFVPFIDSFNYGQIYESISVCVACGAQMDHRTIQW